MLQGMKGNHDIKSQLQAMIEENSENEFFLQNALNAMQSWKSSSAQTIGSNGEKVGKLIKKFKNLIVPVVCDDMFEYVDDLNCTHTLNEFICQRYNDILDNEEVKASIMENLYYGITLHEQDCNDSICSDLYNAYKEAVNNGRIRLKDSVMQFLRKGNFPVIITTMGFPVLEKCLYKGKNFNSEWYNPFDRNDLPLNTSEGMHTVYHIFGGKAEKQWAYNEQTLLMFVHALHSGDYGAKNLSNYLCGNVQEECKRLLALGSTLPDWLFRFFVYPMYEDKMKDVVGYWISLNNIELGLSQFLERNRYNGQANLKQEGEVENIMKEATDEKTVQQTELMQKYNIFMSYKREPDDKDAAKRLERVKEILAKQGSVWQDKEKVSDGGNPYWANIKKAVKRCNLFVPLITLRYLEDYRNAPDIERMAEERILDANKEESNDNDEVKNLKPVVREAYYALAYKKRCCPIVIDDGSGCLNGGTMEEIVKNMSDSRNLPLKIFYEHTILVHDNKNPVLFDLSKK